MIRMIPKPCNSNEMETAILGSSFFSTSQPKMILLSMAGMAYILKINAACEAQPFSEANNVMWLRTAIIAENCRAKTNDNTQKFLSLISIATAQSLPSSSLTSSFTDGLPSGI